MTTTTALNQETKDSIVSEIRRAAGKADDAEKITLRCEDCGMVIYDFHPSATIGPITPTLRNMVGWQAYHFDKFRHHSYKVDVVDRNAVGDVFVHIDIDK